MKWIGEKIKKKWTVGDGLANEIVFLEKSEGMGEQNGVFEFFFTMAFQFWDTNFHHISQISLIIITTLVC